MTCSCEGSPDRCQLVLIELEIIAVDSLDSCIEEALLGPGMQGRTVQDRRFVVVGAQWRETLVTPLYCRHGS